MFIINELANSLSKLPGIGKKSAMRLAYFLLKNGDVANDLSSTINNTIKNVKNCSVCGNFTLQNICEICSNTRRDNSIICVVEEPKDLIAIEETALYNGQYHILMGTINPLEGIGPEKLRIKELVSRLKSNKFEEIFIATNPTIDGETTFLYIESLIRDIPIKKSRMATGLPMGGLLEYTDKFTLGKAIQLKQYF